jgi:hypothetical protein
MPTTVLEGFKQLRSNLEITDLQQGTVSTRQKNIRSVLDEGLSVKETFLTGSYMRSTMIGPLKKADVDVFAVLDVKYYQQSGQAALLDTVKRVLKKHYNTPDISRNGQAVTITFSDFVVDVVPGFYRTGGGYLIPDSPRGVWISTDPSRHVQLWSEANAYHRGNLIPLIKMIKAWNRAHSSLLRSFHLECLVRQILTGITISDFPSGARYVFDKARLAVKGIVLDPSGYGGNVGNYLDTQVKIDAVVSRLETAYQRARDAEQFDKAGRPKDAFDKWRMIFGDYFPAYG